MAITIFLFLLFLSYIVSQPKFKGAIGEWRMRRYLSQLDEEKYIVLNDVIIPTSRVMTTQIDHIIISVNGLFVIETKNYKGWIFGEEKSPQWKQVIYKRKEYFQNPIHQNYGHVKAIQELVGESYSGPIYSIIAFSSRATLKKINVKNPNVIVTYDLWVPNTIRKMNEAVISNFQMKKIYYSLQRNELKGREAKRDHVKHVKEIMENKRILENANTCPKCGGTLIKREGKFGAFYGCSNYPKCRAKVARMN